ncbi:MAG: nickel-dependent lactate racemase [Lentisphaerae bacterium]|nr:nickel-dependent lactate racemase [Lentisphaerota bacterium]
MKIGLKYGTGDLSVEIPSERVTVIRPAHQPGLADEAQAFQEAVRRPIGSKPLRDLVAAGERVAVVIPDLTRPLPSDRLLRWLFAELNHVRPEHVTIINGTGTHRGNTAAELERMVGPDILARYRVVNHVATDPQRLRVVGTRASGKPIAFNRDYVEADRRIVLGFIEPHFMAGFSGGYKGVMPGIADLDTILEYHGARIVGDPRSNWGELSGNPTQDYVRHHGALLPVDFLINVTLNARREITAYFCGDVLQAHNAGCAVAKRTAMAGFDAPFPIVVTTNSGYPLDLNLYQTVKGLSAAAKIVSQGGLILCASRCNDGFPEHGNFKRLLLESRGPQPLLDTIHAPGFSLFDQWEAQLLAIIQLKARIGLHSELPDDDVRRAHLMPTHDLSRALRDELARTGPEAAIAVLPEGPMSIPYLR